MSGSATDERNHRRESGSSIKKTSKSRVKGFIAHFPPAAGITWTRESDRPVKDIGFGGDASDVVDQFRRGLLRQFQTPATQEFFRSHGPFSLQNSLSASRSFIEVGARLKRNLTATSDCAVIPNVGTARYER